MGMSSAQISLSLWVTLSFCFEMSGPHLSGMGRNWLGTLFGLSFLISTGFSVSLFIECRILFWGQTLTPSTPPSISWHSIAFLPPLNSWMHPVSSWSPYLQSTLLNWLSGWTWQCYCLQLVTARPSSPQPFYAEIISDVLLTFWSSSYLILNLLVSSLMKFWKSIWARALRDMPLSRYLSRSGRSFKSIS